MSNIGHHVLAFGLFYDLSVHIFYSLHYCLTPPLLVVSGLDTNYVIAIVWLISLLALFIVFCSIAFSNFNKANGSVISLKDLAF